MFCIPIRAGDNDSEYDDDMMTRKRRRDDDEDNDDYNQALVYDILPSRRKVPESDARCQTPSTGLQHPSECGSECVTMIVHIAENFLSTPRCPYAAIKVPFVAVWVYPKSPPVRPS